MRTSAKIITALSVTGLAVVAGSAFTGAGLSTGVQASQAQFIGGTVSQAVTGATLDSLVYGFTDGTKTSVKEVTLTFADTADNLDGVAGKTVQLVLSGGNSVTFTCDNTASLDDATPDVVLCTTTNTNGQSGVTSASVTVI